VFLSRLTLSLHDRKVQRTLQDAYRVHQALLAAFSPDVPGGGGRVLYRVEPEQEGAVASVLVQSISVPDWRRDTFTAKLPVARAEGPKDLSVTLHAGQTLRFRLRANPTRKKDGKRLAVIGEEAQLAWLRRKLGGYGMHVVAARRHDEGMVHASRRAEEDSRMTFLSIFYEGIVGVEDPVAAIVPLTEGIGSGKAFGFGLLSLSRA
jgi:CRISPR system Cascade subunit CasE